MESSNNHPLHTPSIFDSAPKDTENAGTYPAQPKNTFTVDTAAALVNLTRSREHIVPCTPPVNNSDFLVSKSANAWITESMLTPRPRMLFGGLWHENELCILFADTNTGKSILAVQICDSITKGIPLLNLPLEVEAQTVLYLDFELSAKQFELRYSEPNTPPYRFSELFYRAEINPNADIPDGVSIQEQTFQDIETLIISTGTKIVVVDNLTYLSDQTEKAGEASPLMKELRFLKNKYELSILVVAHTPKRDPHKPLSRNDLVGSRMVMNFADSSFAIGEAAFDKNLRYIKQIKQRNTECLFDEDNVLVVQLERVNALLGFTFLRFCAEYELLQQQTPDQKETLKSSIVELQRSGLTQKQIAEKLGITQGQVSKLINRQNR